MVFFSGRLDEARVWNYARTQTEIQGSMTSEILTPTTGLLGRWGLNDATGTTASNLNRLGLTSFTLEAWVKRDAGGATMSTGTNGFDGLGGRPNGIYPVLTKGMGEGETPANLNTNYFMGITANGFVGADFEDTAGGANHPAWGTTSISVGQWHHIAVTYTGSCWAIYVDGNPDPLNAAALACPNATPEASSYQHPGLAAGINSTGGLGAGFLAGTIDEARVWNVARSQADIQSTKDSEITSGTGLVARWGLNEGTGTAVGNSVAGGVNGTTVANPSWVAGFTPPDATPPAAPTGLTAVAGTNQINLTWNANTESDLAGYNLYRSATSSVPTNGTPVNGATLITGTSYTDQCPLNGDNYYALVAVDTSNNVSDPSTEANTSITLTSAGCGLQFNGSDNYVTFGTASGLGVTTFTLEAWVKRSAGGTAMGTGTGGLGTGSLPMAYPVLTKGRGEAETPANLNTNYWLGIATTGVIAADFEDTAGGVNHPVIGTVTIPVGEWHHIAATYDGQTWRLYLDGVLDATSTLSSPFTPESTSIQHAALGSALQSNGAPGTSPGFFAGVIDEARVWNVARSQALIQNDKNVEITSGSGLIGRWGMNEGSGAAISSSVGSFPGTLTNGPLWVAGFVPPAPGNQAPNAPALNAPANNATGVGTSPMLDVGVSDPDNNPLTVTYFGRPYSSGVFAQIAQNTGVVSGSNIAAPWSNLDGGQQYEWYVTVSDGTATTTGPTWTFRTSLGADPVFVGVGDIAECTNTNDSDTAAIVQGVDGTVFTTGDNVYPTGTTANFTNCYGPSWGIASIKSRTRPIPGNHDWGTGVIDSLTDYFAYFGANATDAGGKSYYSYNILGSNWHVVNLDSECQLVPGGCTNGSPQETWLEADLAANMSKNVIALWHKPRFSSGATNYTDVQPFLDDLYAAGADLVLVGHDHVYERFAPLNASGTPDATFGIRHFTVGMGGASHHSFGSTRTGSEARDAVTYGIFKLTLHATSYDWEFMPVAGGTFTDSGTGSVHGPPVPPTSTPTATQTSAPTATPTNTAVPTATATPSQTPTDIPTSTPTDTLVPPTATETPTDVPTATPTDEPTATPTNTLPAPSVIPTDTQVPTATETPTDVPTATQTPTNTAVPPTATQTPTDTPIPPTATPTNTAVAPTATSTPTTTQIPPCAFDATLVGCWKMEENGGLTLFDGSSFANHASITGSPVWAPGRIGTYSLLLDGTTEFAAVSDNSSLDITNQITIMAWIKPGRVATQDLVKKAINGGTNGYELSLASSTSAFPQKVFFRINQVTNGDTYRVNSTTLYPVDGNTWMHVAATLDGANLRIYINGQLEATTPASGQMIATNNLALGIGAQSDGTRLYQGGLDDVRIYNRALPLTEIQEMISVPTATPTFTPTPTDLPTATQTATATASATQTATDTSTPLATNTATITATAVPTGTATTTATPSQTATALATPTQTATLTATPIASTTPTGTQTPSGLACTALQPKPMTASTGEKPQSKVWNHAGAWWAVFPTNASSASSAGTWLWKLQGTSWVDVLKLSNSTTAKADVKATGNLAHILLYDGTATQLISAEFNGATYQPWTTRPAASPLSLSGSEIATIEIDSTGRMWLASENDTTDQIIVYYSDSPYSTWNGPVTLASGVNDDDISAIVKLPNQIGVLWSNQTTQRFGFRLHTDGADPNTWSADEVPASQSALNVGLGMADDHLNMKVASDGTIYAAVKTSYDTAGFPRIALLVRRPGGTWDNLYNVDEAGTRGIVMLDEANSVLTMVYTSSEGFNSIVYKQSNIPTINFGSLNTLRSGSFNDVSSTKSNYNGEIVLLYASSSEVAGQLCTPSSASNINITGTPLSAFSSQPGVPSAEQSYSVSGSGLTGNITITAPTDFEVSTTSGSGFSPAVTLTQSGGTVPNTTIYVRFSRATAGSANGNITHVSAGATTQNVAVSGTAGSSGSVTFAAFGDYGANTTAELNVANLVKSWNPDFIITTGDNSYDAGPIDTNIGQYYSDFIGNYVGTYGSGSPVNRFFPSMGNHDYTDGGGSAAYLNYFTLPGNERYYDFVQGPVHFFVLDANPAGLGNAPGDGRSPTSAQRAWLQAGLAASTSPWKIVYFHYPPYSSSTTHGSEVPMQWPFEAWGATAVIGGHDHTYERILRDDNNNGVKFAYFVAGTGGRSLYPFGTTVAGSQVRYNANFGSMRVQASSSSITFEFWSIDGGGTLVDNYTINAVPSGGLPITAGSTWKYLDNGTDQGTAWKDIAFDDSAWASGPAELGYGDTADGRPETTLVNCGPGAPACTANNFITTYFRKEFNVPDRSIYSGLNLSLLRDDGAVVYLNGAEIWRTNMPTGTVTYTTPASTAIGTVDETTFVSPPSPLANTLVDGTNVLAVEIHQSSATSTDISFDLSLSGTPAGSTCNALTLSHTGNGTTPTVSPANSTGCPTGPYLAGQAINLSGAVPDSGWQIASWFGTSNDTSTGNTNSLSMPAGTHSAGVNYSVSSSGTTVSFQEGVGGYSSTVDNHIKQASPTTSFGTAPTVEWDLEETAGNPATQVFGLIRFDNIFGSGGGQIPSGATITSATLQYTVTNSTANAASSVNEVLATWDETTTYNTFGGTAGVQPEDFGTLVTTAPGNSLTTFTINVTSSLAAWSSNPAANRGWIIRPAGTDGVDIASSENATVANRPKLTITYAGAPTEPPAAPSAMAATVEQANQIHLIWTDNANNEANFELERSTTGIGGTYGLLATLPANTIAYDDSNLTASQEYCYRVRAVNALGQSSYAGPVCAMPLGAEALDLGNGNAYVTFGNAAPLGLSQFTLETWFKREGTGTNANTGTGGVTAVPLITKGVGQADNSNLDMNYFLGIRSSDNVICADFEEGAAGTSPGLNHPACGSTAILNNVWYHVAATYDGSTWRLYVNGNLDATLNVNQPVRSDSIQHAGLGVALTSTGTASGHFDGVLDEARVWNFARTQTQIRSTLNSQITTSQTGLVARWALNDGGTTVAGSAGTTVNGTISGTGYTWVTPGAPFDIIVNDPPNTPVLVSPANNATNVSTSPTLQATVSDPNGGNLNVTFYGRPVSAAPPPGPDFTIVVVPDTQYYVSSLNGGSPAIMQSQMNWIVNNIASRNIVFVTQLGDCTEHGDEFELEWQNADAAFDLIENPTTTGLTQGMPYGIAVGNHDQSPIGNPNGTTTFFNQYFGEARFQGRAYYGGHFGTNNDNHYELFSASGMDFIIVHLEYDPSANAAVLAWADGLLQTHSNRRAIVVTHHMINGGNPGSFSAQGQAIYNTLRDNPNLFLLLGGHVPSPAEGQRQDTFNGNVVNSLLSDYQGRTNGGNGWMRIMTFSPANNTIQVQTYSPWLNQFETDTDSQFTLAYNMQGSGAPFTQIGTTSVSSGSTASLAWPGRTANTQYEWYAAASDGISTTNSSTFTFTTGSVAATNTPTNTPTSVATNTPTSTPVPPTGTPTNTPVPSTGTPTNTPTNTVVPPTSTPTNTPTNTPVPPTSTPTNTATNTSIAPTSTPTNTPTNTPIPPTATPTATQTSTPSTSTVTFTPVADSYVNASSATTNYGTWSTLRVDGSPIVRSYLRFNVQGLNGTVTRATLRIFANSSLNVGFQANGVNNNTWTETGINYNNAPAVGATLGSSGNVSANTWKTIDVTSFITGNGSFNLALTTTSSTALSLASRESGANAPQLIIESQSGSATSTPTSTATNTSVPPTSTSTNTPTNTPVPATSTPTNTPTNTPLPTNTPTATQLATATNTATSTVVPTATATAIATSTPTPTATGAPTSTSTATATPSQTPTITPTVTSSILTFLPIADSYVDANSPNAINGSLSTLRADGSPIVRSYLRFNVQTVNGPITKATLRIFANSSHSLGVDARGVSNSTWTEATLNYNNAPPVGSVLGSSGSVSANTWKTIDVTSFITGNGVFNLAVTTNSSTAISLASRESGNTPQLIVETGGGSIPTATFTPTSTGAPTSTPTLTSTPTAVGTSTPTATPTPTQLATATPTATSSPSPTATPTQTATGNLFTFNPIADSYVEANNSNSNFGTSTQVRVDGTPIVRAYLRFNIQGVGGTVTRATLRIYANSTSSSSLAASGVSDNTWTETGINYNNAPPLGSSLGSAGPVVAGTWISIDITAYITGNGTYNLALTTPGSTAISLSSRQGANPPRLVIETGP